MRRIGSEALTLRAVGRSASTKITGPVIVVEAP
jgi:hypothetical protein